MFGWLKNKKINSIEYSELAQKILGVDTELQKLKSKFEILETNYSNLRGNFNRKLKGIKEEEDTNDDNFDEIKQIREAFGGDIPIELVEKYKNRRNF